MSNIDITEDDLDEVYSVTSDAQFNWRNVLVALGVSRATVDRIGEEWRGRPDICYREGLSEWLKSGKRTWKDLYNALSSQGENRLADKIKQTYLPSYREERTKLSGEGGKLARSPTSMEELHTLLLPARSLWFEIGLMLGLDYNQLIALSDSASAGGSHLLRVVLTRRLESESLTWSEVCTCLRSLIVGREDIAVTIEKKFASLRINLNEKVEAKGLKPTPTKTDPSQEVEAKEGLEPTPTKTGPSQEVEAKEGLEPTPMATDVSEETMPKWKPSGRTPMKPKHRRAFSTSHIETSLYSQGEFNLHGVEAVKCVSVTIDKSKNVFEWSEWGFKLHVPADSLPPGYEQCTLDILVSTAGQYQLPDNHQLVSAVYWVRAYPVCRFEKKLTIEIQHCAKKTSFTKLSFVRAKSSQNSLPYTFNQVEEHGSFTEQSSYGSLEVNGFSGYGVISPADVKKRYIASLYSKKQAPRELCIHFVISLDLKAHQTGMKNELQAEERAVMLVEFEKEEITLNIPMDGGVKVNEWTLIPLVSPCIKQTSVDSFDPVDSKVKSCKLRATLPKSCVDQEIDTCYHLIMLDGASESANKMNIEIDEYPLSTDVTQADVIYNCHACGTSLPPLTRGHSYPLDSQTGATYQLRPIASQGQPLTLEKLLKQMNINVTSLDKPCENKLLIKIGGLLPNWLQYAHMLGLSEQDINGIRTDPFLSNDWLKSQKVLEKWRNANPGQICLDLIKVCLELQHGRTAMEICQKVIEEENSVSSHSIGTSMQNEH